MNAFSPQSESQKRAWKEKTGSPPWQKITCTATSITQPNPTTTVSWEFSLFFQENKCIASTATSSIILLRNNKYIVERNSDNKPEGCISQKGNIKIFVSHSTDISDLGLHDMLSYGLLDAFEL